MRTAHPIDQHVGQRIKSLRTDRQLSQTALAEAIGISFYQVRKYEAGTSRISVSQLFNIAAVLGVPVGIFFNDCPDCQKSASVKPVTDDLESIDLEIVRALSGVVDPSVKQQLLKFILSLIPHTTM